MATVGIKREHDTALPLGDGLARALIVPALLVPGTTLVAAALCVLVAGSDFAGGASDVSPASDAYASMVQEQAWREPPRELEVEMTSSTARSSKSLFADTSDVSSTEPPLRGSLGAI